MTKEEIYDEMLKIRRQKNNAISTRENYETFMEKIDKLLENLKKSKDCIVKLELMPQGLSVDEKSVDNGKIGEFKKDIESIITDIQEARNETNNQINALNNRISSLESRYRNLNNQYQTIS